MVRHMPIIHINHHQIFSPIPLAIGLFVSISLLVSLCAKHAKKFQRKYTSKTSDPNTAKSHKATLSLIHTKKSRPDDHGVNNNDNNKGNEENGLWQKAILMGEKCQPPEFSGVIYYDYSGKRISEMPKSPLASSVSPLRNFTFPVQRDESSMY